jgi:hypothetical protein
LLASAEEVNSPVITSGRAVDPARADEMVVSEDLAARLGLTVGDRVTLESMTDDWVDSAFNGGDPGPPDGPKVEVEVVGLSRTPADFARWDGILHLSPAFVEQYAGRMRMYHRVEVQLSDDASRHTIADHLRALGGDVDTQSALFGGTAATDDALNAIATALRIIAAVAALAGAVVIALALVRVTRLGLGDHRTLVALGWTTRQLALAALLVFTPWLLLGIALGIVGGVLLAPEVLVGLARSVDPAPSSIVVNRAIAVGTGLTAVALGAMVVAATARRLATARPTRVGLPRRVVPLDRPLPLVLGMRQALAGGAERGGRSSRSAVVVMAAGLAGAVAALLVGASISHLQSDGYLFGQGDHGRVIDSGESLDVYDRALPQLDDDARVSKLAGIHIAFGVVADKSEETTLLAYDVRRGNLGASIVSGRLARAPNEAAVGPATLDRLGKSVGDHIALRSEKGSGRFRVVGIVLFPEGDFDHDSGVALTKDGADRIEGDVHDEAALHQVLFDWRDDVDARAADRELHRAGMGVLTNSGALKPASVSNLGEVATLPRYLAVFLGILSLATFANALIVSVRRRSHELATLRALGMTPRATSAIVTSQALTIVGVAVLLGLPAGILLGTRIWTSIAESAYVIVRSVVPGSWIALYVLAVVVAAAALTGIPAMRALRMRAAATLRAE